MFSRSLRLLFPLALVLLFGCPDTTIKSRTQLVLVADTDIAELDGVRFEVTAPDGTTQSSVGELTEGTPAYLVMEHGGASSRGPYKVSVQGLAATAVVVTRTAELWFVAGRTRAALLHLVRACTTTTCEDGLVCSHDGCRAELLQEGELVDWDGSPPTLGQHDAGIDAAVEDAGAAEDAATVDGETPDSGCPTVCEGDNERICSDGVLGPPRPCMMPDQCSTGACAPGKGCVRTPAREGMSCGGALTCQGGVCGGGQACTSKCEPQCNMGTLSCALNCGQSGDDCKPSCVPGSTCDIQCGPASNCETSCAGACKVQCGTASNCQSTCRMGASCDIDCTGTGNCDKTRCQNGAVCVLRCGASNNCRFDTCPGGVTDCGNRVFVCNGACPP